MCLDLLNLDGNKYVHEVPSKSGGEHEKKDILLEDHDPVWLELHHAHIADVVYIDGHIEILNLEEVKRAFFEGEVFKSLSLDSYDKKKIHSRNQKRQRPSLIEGKIQERILKAAGGLVMVEENCMMDLLTIEVKEAGLKDGQSR